MRATVEDMMRRAIELARAGMRAGDGGPFGAVVLRSGEAIGEGWNRVLAENDPTAHGEVMAIRDACRRIESFSLAGCEIVTTGEPCPMCLGAIHWARIERIYYGFRISDAAEAGFDDEGFFAELAKPAGERRIPAGPVLASEASALLGEYGRLPGRVRY